MAKSKSKTKKEKKEKKSEPSAKQKKVQNTFKRAVAKFKEYKEEHPNGEKTVGDFVKAEFN